MFFTVLYAIPMLIGAFITWQTVFHSLVILSPWLTPILPFVYYTLSRTSTKTAYVIYHTPQDGLWFDEQEWWYWDYWMIPEQTKFNRIVERKGKAVLTSERIAWIDARNTERIKAFMPNDIPMVFDLIGTGESKEYVTSANIIGQEAYNQSSYLFAKLRPNGEMLTRNMPWLLILGGSFVAVFFGAGRIAEMMGVQ